MKQYKLPLMATFLSLGMLTLACKDKNQDDKEPVIQTKKVTEPQTWAERLGWPAGKKVLVLHADDIGMCPEANHSVKPMLTEGQIQSAAVMIPCPNSQEFMHWVQGQPKLDIGLHLTLTSEWETHRWGPVSPKDSVKGLMDETGNFWRSVPEVVEHATAKEVETEIRAQIEKSIEWGHRPTHIDTHMGTLYADKGYTEAFLRLAMEYGVPANAIDLTQPKVAQHFRDMGYPIDDQMIQLIKDYDLPKLDFFGSVPGALTYEEKIEAFKQTILSFPSGLTEIIFHPSEPTENLKNITDSWQQRGWEAEMFADPAVVEFLEEEDIIFTNWKEIMERFEKIDK
ncbi:MAG TPA: hypothetical protein DEF18_05295 [Muricauda sp.]|nr:hypothetical protein [Allomuricauda sp.]HBU77498.1 hypothetical protein [Allomuricauda sp.]|tara:strand:+ start:150 stop:1169 length:1020 start_codon:yes stop_codon:yes gene_type:complete